MISQRIRELIQGEFDQTNTPAESAEIRKVLESDESAKEYEREFRAIESVFQSMPLATPSPLLKQRIFAEIDNLPPSAGTGGSSDWSRKLDRGQRHLTKVAAIPFAFGLAAGIAGLMAIQGIKVDPDQTIGTVHIWQHQSTEALLEGGLVNGTLGVGVQGNKLHVKLFLSSTQEVPVTLSLHGRHPGTLISVRSEEGKALRVSTSNQQGLSLTHSGVSSYVFEFQIDKDFVEGAIRIVTSESEELYAGTVLIDSTGLRLSSGSPRSDTN